VQTFIVPVIFLAIGQSLRVAARRIEDGNGPDLPTLAGYAFAAAGVAMIVGGIVKTFDTPAGLVLVVFGIVFLGASYIARRVLATPEGQQAISVDEYEAGVRNLDGTSGTRRQGTVIHVAADASDEEIAAARRDWARRQWAKRPDWVAGRIIAEDERTGGTLYAASAVWTVFALGAIAAGLAWGGIAWWFAFCASLIAGFLVVASGRTMLRRRRFRASEFLLQETPARLGGTLAGEVISGVPQADALRDGFRVTLRCVHRWRERTHRATDGTRPDRYRRDVLWESEQTSAGHAPTGDTNLSVPIELRLPADQPATSLSDANAGIQWELEVRAAMPGIDYQARFLVPVLAPGPEPTTGS